MDFARKFKCLAVFTALYWFLPVGAHKLNAQGSALDEYIRLGLENNLALKQKQDSYAKSLQVLKEAAGMFYPSLSLYARYTVAQGGRIIEFPVGDLLNPVYQSLNELTGSEFPMLENQEFPFFRPREQETKLQLVQPLINTQLYFNRKIKAELAETERIDAEVYKSFLIREIKTSYFNFLKALSLNFLLENTRLLLEENVRVNESLFKNDKVTRDVLLRSQAEMGKLDVQITESEKMSKTSAAYFNFLLNRPLQSNIVKDSMAVTDDWHFTISETTDQAMNKREELKILEKYNAIADLNYKMNQYNRIPDLLGIAEYGYQGEKYGFAIKSSFLMAGVVFRWNIFSGFQQNTRIQQAGIEKAMAEKQYTEAKSKIELEVMNAWYDLQASLKAIESSERQSEALKAAFEIIRRKYSEGQVNLVEFMDARTAMTNAEENIIISRYDFMIKKAELERVTNQYSADFPSTKISDP